ncbi:hypothetical protein LOAG_13029 [Loa loa]|uniref:Uncharacterized protein n=1 Tax=Loa loa TaxID=7209 RepID=A0A1S0TK63_LOALO|nr:hypothetical protein LOAG_13029 [Loa loa]EFO15482.1 hypothetical protein LOAG_13029 [Loa loa]
MDMYILGDTNRDILCTDSLTCNEHHRLWWLHMRNHANNIQQFMEHKRYKNEIEGNELSVYSLKMRYILCKEVQSVGFMIDTRNDQWPLRCLWIGNAMNGTCAPAPPSNRSIFYITPKEWQQKVKVYVLIDI